MRQFFLILITVFYFVVLGPAIIFLALNFSILSSPNNLKKSFGEINFYERVHNLKASDISSTLNPENRDPESEIPEEMIQKVIDSVSPAVLQTSIEQGLDSAFTSIKKQSDYIEIDLKDIKQDVIVDQPTKIATEIEKTIPDVYQIQQTEETTNITSIIFNKLYQYLGLIVLVLFFIVAVLLAQSARSKSRTASLLFLFFGIISLLISFLVDRLPYINNITDINELSGEVGSIVSDLANQIITNISNMILVWGLSAIGLSIIIFAFSYAFPKPELKTSPKPEAKSAS